MIVISADTFHYFHCLFISHWCGRICCAEILLMLPKNITCGQTCDHSCSPIALELEQASCIAQCFQLFGITKYVA